MIYFFDEVNWVSVFHAHDVFMHETSDSVVQRL